MTFMVTHLPAPLRPKRPTDVPSLDRQVDAVQHEVGAEAGLEGLHLEQGRHHHHLAEVGAEDLGVAGQLARRAVGQQRGRR